MLSGAHRTFCGSALSAVSGEWIGFNKMVCTYRRVPVGPTHRTSCGSALSAVSGVWMGGTPASCSTTVASKGKLRRLKEGDDGRGREEGGGEGT